MEDDAPCKPESSLTKEYNDLVRMKEEKSKIPYRVLVDFSFSEPLAAISTHSISGHGFVLPFARTSLPRVRITLDATGPL